MSASKKIGRITVRPQKIKGRLTGKTFVDVPADLTGDGRRRRPLFETRKEAIGFAKALWQDAQAGRGFRAAGEPAKPRLTFLEAAQAWELEQRGRVGSEEKRANSFVTDLNRLAPLRAFFGEKDLFEIREADVREYLEARRKKGVTRRTRNSELALLKFVMRESGRKEVPQVKSTKVHQLCYAVPTKEEVVKILEQLSGRKRLVVWLCSAAGLRPDEVRHATWAWFKRTKDGPVVSVGAHANWEPKTAESARDVALPEQLFDAIQALERTSYWVFPSDRDLSKPMGDMRKALRSAAERAELERDGVPVSFSLKMFRKAFGTWLADAGVGSATIQDLVGHRRGSRITAEFYIGHDKDKQRAATARIRFEVPEQKLAISGNDAEPVALPGSTDQPQQVEK
jgi:integrase